MQGRCNHTQLFAQTVCKDDALTLCPSGKAKGTHDRHSHLSQDKQDEMSLPSSQSYMQSDFTPVSTQPEPCP